MNKILEKDIRIIYKQTDNGFVPITVDWNKMPCKNCEWRYAYVCPQCQWNKDGKYLTY